MSPAGSRFAGLFSFTEQSRRQAIQHTKRTVTTVPAQDAGIMAGHECVLNEERTQDQERICRPVNSYPKGLANVNIRSPECPNVRNPADLHNRAGTSGFRHDGNMVGYSNSKATIDSANLVQAGNFQDTRNTHNDAQERYGSNAGAVSRDSMALPLDRGISRPDAASPFQRRPQVDPYAASFVNQRPQDELLRDVMPSQKGDISRQQDISASAEEYNVRKARVHASLWQQEILKQAGEATAVKGGTDSESSQSFSNVRVGKDISGWESNKAMPEDWETFDPEGQFYDESLAKEEAMMFEEFDKRRERNRILIASFVKQHLYGRRRPVDGWKYILNNFGLESKGAKGSALGGRQTTGNELEKLALKRESGRLRRKD